MTKGRNRKRRDDLPPDIVIGEADNPYTHAGAQRKIQVVYTTRDDPLRGMLVRKQIDVAQFEAGLLYQKYHEQAEIGGLRGFAINDPVDGGPGFPEPISDAQRKAVKRLNEAAATLGARGTEIVSLVLLKRYSIIQVAAAYATHTRAGIEYQGRRFRECLEALAKLWGLAG